MNKILPLYRVCVSVFPFLSYMSMLVPIVLSCWYEGLFTNYGNVVKFISVPSFMCINFLLVHAHYIFHFSLMWYVLKCTVYQQIMRTMSSKQCQNIAVKVIRLYGCIRCAECLCSLHELHKSVYLCCSCFGKKVHCLPTNCGNIL